MGAYLTYLELSTVKGKQVIAFLIDVRCKCSQILQMTAEKTKLAKKIPSLLKKKSTFSTYRIPLAVGSSCVTFSATRGQTPLSTLTLVSETLKEVSF
jgi:hypothetical protein